MAPRPLNVAVIGFGWMGEVHARAYARLPHHYPELALRPVLRVVADPEAARGASAVQTYGFDSATTSWRDVVDDADVDAVSVAAPNFLHREIGVAVAASGKHLWIEKPVGLGTADARAVADAVEQAGVQSAVGFNYRNAPAVALARELIAGGEIGRVTNARVRLFSDYAAHPLGSLSWRFLRETGGSGVLGDLVSHGVDLARYLFGELDSLVADTATVINARPQVSGATSHFAVGGGELVPVENEDLLSALLRTSSGALITMESSRVSVGDQCTYGVEVHGTKGSLVWDFRRMGELQVSSGGEYVNQAARTVFVSPGDGEYAAFQPGPGNAMSFDDLKVIEAHRFVESIATGKPGGATIADAVRSALVLDAMIESVRDRRWVDLR